jgi:hypothetical protein
VVDNEVDAEERRAARLDGWICSTYRRGDEEKSVPAMTVPGRPLVSLMGHMVDHEKQSNKLSLLESETP